LTAQLLPLATRASQFHAQQRYGCTGVHASGAPCCRPRSTTPRVLRRRSRASVDADNEMSLPLPTR
jgi:hypothetical protein